MSINKINLTKAIEEAKSSLIEDTSMSKKTRAIMNILITVISLLTAKLGMNSSNSSKPPSTDPNRKKKKAKGTDKKPGGQKGRKGSNLKPVKDPDVIEPLKIDKRTLPAGDYKDVGFERRQVFDIVVSSQVTEYQAQILEDASGKRFMAEFPEGVSRPAQYGAGLKAHSVYMSMFQLIPYDRIRDYFADQCNIPVSAGSIFNFNLESYNRLEEFEEIARRNLISASHAHADETGINVSGKRLWLHCVSNLDWTLFHPHEKRGGEAMTSMAVLPYFNGTLTHDHWKPYFQLSCLHALCNAHHLRELEGAWENDQQKWARNMQQLLLEINDAVEKAGGILSKEQYAAYLKRYRSTLTRGESECPPAEKIPGKRGRTKQTKSRNLLERLQGFETETLRFTLDPMVPFTNNLGENDIRMTKVQQKISGCFRSMEGAKIFCRVRSYLSTCRKRGMMPSEALKILFQGKMPDFIK